MPYIAYEEQTLENAYIYKHCTLPLGDQGLVFVRGLNLDDGGALGTGKSTLFNAMARLQFGKGGKSGELADEIINADVGKNLHQVLRLTVDDHPYEIRQYRKHDVYGTRFEVIDRDTNRNILPKTKYPHLWIKSELLKTDDATFFNIVYLTQGMIDAFMRGKESERRQKLTVMFNLEVYDQFYEQVKSRIRLAEADRRSMSGWNEQLDDLRTQLRQIGDVKTLRRRYNALGKKLEAHQAELYVTVKELEEKQAELERLKLRSAQESELQALWEKSTKLQERFDSIDDITEEAVDELEAEVEQLAEEKAQLPGQEEAARKRVIIESQLQKLDQELEEGDVTEEDLEEELSTIKEQLYRLGNVELPAAEKHEALLQELAELSIDSPNLAIAVLRDEYNDSVQDISVLSERLEKSRKRLSSGICSECKRPLYMNNEEIAELKKSISSDRSRLKKLRERHFNLKTIIDASDEYERIQAQLDALPEARAPSIVMKEMRRLQGHEKKVSHILELLKQREQLEGQLEHLPDVDPNKLERRIKRIRNKHRIAKQSLKVASQLLQLKTSLEQLPSGSTGELSKEVGALRRTVRSVNNRIQKRSEKHGEMRVLLRTATRLRRQIKALRIKLREAKTLQEDLDCLEALKVAFGPKGLKQDRFRAILTDAAERTIPTYSSLLWPNKKVRLDIDDSDGIHFFMKRQRSRTVMRSNLLSGGENHKASLAFLLGMRDLKEAYTTTSFNVLIIDEPFGNLDPQGSESLLSILEALKERFSSIFIVSHRPEVISSPIWDQTWWAIRKNNVSKLFLEDPPVKYRKLAQQA